MATAILVDDSSVITNKREVSYELPETGSIGKNIFVNFGMLMVVLGGLFYCFYRRREND